MLVRIWLRISLDMACCVSSSSSCFTCQSTKRIRFCNHHHQMWIYFFEIACRFRVSGNGSQQFILQRRVAKTEVKNNQIMKTKNPKENFFFKQTKKKSNWLLAEELPVFHYEIESHGTSGRMGGHSFDDGPRFCWWLVHFRLEDSGQQLLQMSGLSAASHSLQHLHLIAVDWLVDGLPRELPLQLVAVLDGRTPHRFQLLGRDPSTTKLGFNWLVILKWV